MGRYSIIDHNTGELIESFNQKPRLTRSEGSRQMSSSLITALFNGSLFRGALWIMGGLFLLTGGFGRLTSS